MPAQARVAPALASAEAAPAAARTPFEFALSDNWVKLTARDKGIYFITYDALMSAGVDPQFVVDPGEEFDSVVDEAWEAFLGEELGPRAARPGLWRRVLALFSLGELRTIAEELARFRVPATLHDRSACAGGT